MSKDYVHSDIGVEVTAIAGSYTHEKELRLTHNGQEVLSIIGFSVIDTSCCGMGGGRFAIVPGYLIKYRYREEEDGRAVSEVEPIEDEWDTRREIIRLIEEKEAWCDVRFLN